MPAPDFNNKQGSVARFAYPVARIQCDAPTYYVASWKGFEFFVDTSSDEFGRRGDIYEYPLSDYIGYKDLGKKADRFKLEGYLLGTNQLDQARQMRSAAVSPEPGQLIHPLFGSMQVACILLTMTADYRRDKKRTKLSFDFCEANMAMAPYAVDLGLGDIFGAGSESIFASQQGAWGPDMQASAMEGTIKDALRSVYGNPIDTESFNGLDMISPAPMVVPMTIIPPAPMAFGGARMEAPIRTPSLLPGIQYPLTLKAATDPIDYASATIRRIHFDALERLKEFNALVVQRTEQLKMPSPSVQSLIITTRLIMIRDYAIASAAKNHDTIKAALDDLDFIMAVYDDEEALATQRCDDVLVAAIRKARASAASVILSRNIRKPGIAEFPTDGVWPSLLVAQKLYNDGRRYEQIEKYNSQMTPLFMGGPPGPGVIAPAR